jgi:NAD(P)-dependent dehydrogenase (short-subunit alcohol dehydrogenase family)
MPTAVVTGANRGLGLETARSLLRRGFRVWLTGRDAEGVAMAAADLRSAGLDVLAATLDVADPSSVDAFAKRLAGDEPVDALINNAGSSLPGFDARVAGQTLEINYRGAVRVTDAVLPMLAPNASVVMVSSGMGELKSFSGEVKARLLAPMLTRPEIERIAEEFVASIGAGTYGAAGFPPNAYSVSKALMNAFTRVLARALPSGQRVNAVCPGWVRTRMGGSSAPRSLEQGADGIVWAATLGESGPSGGFFRDGRPIAW